MSNEFIYIDVNVNILFLVLIDYEFTIIQIDELVYTEMHSKIHYKSALNRIDTL